MPLTKVNKAKSARVFSPSVTGPVADCSTYKLEYTASNTVAGTYNWSDHTYGPVDDIYSGGTYRVWFTDLNGCISYRDFSVPFSLDKYFEYFPSGCYDLCKQQLPLTITAPPLGIFPNWAWLLDGAPVEAGTGTMLPYSITGGGSYQWSLYNGVCKEQSAPMDVKISDCRKCQLGV